MLSETTLLPCLIQVTDYPPNAQYFSLQVANVLCILLYPGLILIDYGHFQYPLLIRVCTFHFTYSQMVLKPAILINTSISNGVKVLGILLHQLSVIFILTFQ